MFDECAIFAANCQIQKNLVMRAVSSKILWWVLRNLRKSKQVEKSTHFHNQMAQWKLAAGWLIDQCHLKGFQIGGAAVHQQQALVLINNGNATGQDVVKLHHIRQTVRRINLVCIYSQRVRFMSKWLKWIQSKPLVNLWEESNHEF